MFIKKGVKPPKKRNYFDIFFGGSVIADDASTKPVIGYYRNTNPYNRLIWLNHFEASPALALTRVMQVAVN